MCKCQDCRFEVQGWMTTYDGKGLIQFSYCEEDVTQSKMVDPAVERECEVCEPKSEAGKDKVEALEVEHAS